MCIFITASAACLVLACIVAAQKYNNDQSKGSILKISKKDKIGVIVGFVVGVFVCLIIAISLILYDRHYGGSYTNFVYFDDLDITKLLNRLTTYNVKNVDDIIKEKYEKLDYKIIQSENLNNIIKVEYNCADDLILIYLKQDKKTFLDIDVHYYEQNGYIKVFVKYKLENIKKAFIEKDFIIRVVKNSSNLIIDQKFIINPPHEK